MSAPGKKEEELWECRSTCQDHILVDSVLSVLSPLDLSEPDATLLLVCLSQYSPLTPPSFSSPPPASSPAPLLSSSHLAATDHAPLQTFFSVSSSASLLSPSLLLLLHSLSSSQQG